ADPDLTTSGKILKDMKEGELSFFEFSMQQSRIHRDYLQNGGLSDAAEKLMKKTAAESLLEQAEIESKDTIGFDEYLKNWNKA
ncbi:MAG: glutamate--cysteine ligase, partial [Pseudomonadales bacterium]|nr:glutamate--cysteine ligase [Pseudomonadales bacterium]